MITRNIITIYLEDIKGKECHIGPAVASGFQDVFKILGK
jgi:hypothetical protein